MSASEPRSLISEEIIQKSPLYDLKRYVLFISTRNPRVKIPENINKLDDATARQAIRDIVTDPEVCAADDAIIQEDDAENKADRRERNRPQITVTDAEIHTMTELALAALQANNTPPKIFARGTQMVRVCRDGKDALFIQELQEYELTGIFDRQIKWMRPLQSGKTRSDRPPQAVVKDVLALPPGEWGVPPLSGIVKTPVIHLDGKIQAVPGYDEATHLYYSPENGFALAPVPERPTEEDVTAALEVINEVIVDFPFVGDADRANTIGALLTTVLRPCISGPVPLYLVDKPQAGSGAGLLQRVIGLIALGREPPLKTMPKGEEMRKELFTSLRSGTTIQIFDNIEEHLSNPELAAALTAKMYTGRILGRSEETEVEVRCFWMCNGNNVQIGGDLARRTFKTRIDPQRSMPWQREGFKHECLESWVLENRGKILAAIYTLARAWILADKPRPQKVPRVGSFEAWRDTIGGILEFVGVERFLGNAMEVYEEGDADRIQLEAFISAIWNWTGCNPFTAGVLAKHLNSDDPNRYAIIDNLPDDLADAFIGRKLSANMIGKALARQDGRHFPGGWCLNRGKKQHNAQTWIITYIPPKRGGELRGVSDMGYNGLDSNSDNLNLFDFERGELGEFPTTRTREEKEDQIYGYTEGRPETPQTPGQNSESKEKNSDKQNNRLKQVEDRGVSETVTPPPDYREQVPYSPHPSDYQHLQKPDYGQKCAKCGIQGVTYREKTVSFNRRRGTAALCKGCFEALNETGGAEAHRKIEPDIEHAEAAE